MGGWTEPRQTRQYFGALLLGVHSGKSDDKRLTYVGHTGTGFDQRELERVSKLLRAREVTESPFSERIKTNEPAHWVRPELVAEVRFTEWTDEGKLRQPVYLGLRDDKRPADVIREEMGKHRLRIAQTCRIRNRGRTKGRDTSPHRRTASSISFARSRTRGRTEPSHCPTAHALASPISRRSSGRRSKLTKGDLLRYYATVSPFILPAVDDRPLVMKRFPNGVDGARVLPAAVAPRKAAARGRIETIADDVDPISEPDARTVRGRQSSSRCST